ncbi:hypothetical protein L3X38_023200 [Prunus dulcis]|uniref:Uncharacterized protein n=1 Tax=Prunus dulcis TaxID=3755 RepID=A0AAD4Z515_PRUDU|nr:hypothetical protein L3X38_023200 [Prunus dulcis]
MWRWNFRRIGRLCDCKVTHGVGFSSGMTDPIRGIGISGIWGDDMIVSHGVGFSGVETDPIRGIGISCVWGDYVIVRLKFLGKVKITWEILPKFRQKVPVLSKWVQHRGDVRNSTGFVLGSEEFGAGPVITSRQLLRLSLIALPYPWYEFSFKTSSYFNSCNRLGWIEKSPVPLPLLCQYPPGAQWLDEKSRNEAQTPSASVIHIHTRYIELIISSIVARLRNKRDQHYEEVDKQGLDRARLLLAS